MPRWPWESPVGPGSSATSTERHKRDPFLPICNASGARSGHYAAMVWRRLVLLGALLAACGGEDDGSPPTESTVTPSSSTSTTMKPSADQEALRERAEADAESYERPPEPTLSVTPSSGLVNEQTIAVLAEGLPPGEEVGIAACRPWDPASPTDPQCLYASSGTGTVDEEGRLWFPAYKLPAAEPAIGFDCVEPPGCELAWPGGHGEPPHVTATVEVIH